VSIHPDYLHELSLADNRNDLFPFMWDGLFQELGLLRPPSRWRLDRSLRERGFQLRTAGITGVPWVGLELGRVLVNDSAERLALLGVDAVPTLNPATRQPAAIAGADRKDFLEAAGLTTWDPWGYLILSCAVTLRENAWRFMTLPVTGSMLELLGRASPEVANAVREVVPREVLPRVLRELLFDQVSVRDLRGICEALLRGWTDPEQSNSDPVMLARHRQRFAIAEKAGRGTNTIVVYLLDARFEAQDLSDSAESAGLRAALATEMAHLPQTAQRPAVLTQDARRRDVRRVLRHRFPSMTVLGYGDIPRDWNIQPVARISPP
jgi:type III secretion protein V